MNSCDKFTFLSICTVVLDGIGGKQFFQRTILKEDNFYSFSECTLFLYYLSGDYPTDKSWSREEEEESFSLSRRSRRSPDLRKRYGGRPLMY